MIDKRFLKEGARIREEYLKCYNVLLERDKDLQNIKKELFSVINDLSTAKNEIDEELMNSRINKLEKELDTIQKSINPHVEKISSLGKQADLLYESIKEKFPDVTQEEMKRQMFPYIQEVESKFSFQKN